MSQRPDKSVAATAASDGLETVKLQPGPGKLDLLLGLTYRLWEDISR